MDWLSLREPMSAWTHGVWAVLALPGTWLLWRRAGGDWLKRLGGLLYGLSLVLCLGASFLYHAAPLELWYLLPLDHLGIHVLIAGTMTPITLLVLDGRRRVAVLGAIWLIALSGAALQRWLGSFPLWLTTSWYLAMGWGCCIVYAEVARKLSPGELRPLWLGGLFYTVGAFLLRGWPLLAPGIGGAHEVFHLFVMAGSGCHYWFMIAAVLPCKRAHVPAAPPVAAPASRRRTVRAGSWVRPAVSTLQRESNSVTV
jgi:hemolysin III